MGTTMIFKVLTGMSKLNVLFIMSLIFTVLLSSCSKPYNMVLNKTWEGQLYRIDDDKELSDIRLRMSNDSLLVYANAIFGAANDTLLLVKYEAKDSTFTYKNNSGDNFSFQFKYAKNGKEERLCLIGTDYCIVLKISEIDLSSNTALAFYLNVDVPSQAYMYLDGAYEGEIEMENQFANLYLAGIGGISVKLVFIDNFKVKVYLKSLFVDMFSGSTKPNYEIVNYKVTGNKLILNRNKAKAQTIEVRNNGETLVLATDKVNVIMHKIY